MRQLRKFLCAASAALFAGAAPAQDLSSFLADTTAGTVSAANLVGVEESAVASIETSQDLVLAVKPFSTRGGSRAGFGIAITPTRTALLPVISAADYEKSSLLRALGNITLSYAENSADVSGVSYRKNGFSIDAYYYWNKDHDPVVAAQRKFVDCPERSAADLRAAQARAARRETQAKKAEAEADAAHKACIDEVIKLESPWNATRLSVSAGGAWIRPESGAGERRSLGRSITLGGIFRLGEQGAGHLTLRRTTDEVDLTTLAGTAQYKSSSLAAARYTYGSEADNGELKLLAEVSNAKKTEVTAAHSAYKYAVGLDKKVGNGAWLEFRLGRARTFDGTDLQTTSLLTLKWMPSSGLFAK